MLVWYELCGSMDEAIKREKQLKEWRRGWKIELIEKLNPTWRDLFEEACGSFQRCPRGRNLGGPGFRRDDEDNRIIIETAVTLEARTYCGAKSSSPK